MKLITLTPIHIGDGEELTFLEYIKKNQELHVYPYDYLINKIYETYKGEALLTRLSLFKDFVKSQKIQSLKEFFEKAKIDLEPKYKLVLKNSDLQNVNIKTFIKNLLGFYIPGSEIKGALRTVFIYGVLKSDSKLREKFYKGLRAKIEEVKNIKDKRKRNEMLNKIIQNLENQILRIGEKGDAQYDLFKSILISDSLPIEHERFFVDAVKVINSSKEIKEFCELLKSDSQISIEVKIDKDIALKGLEKVGILNSELKNKNIENITWEFLKKSAIDFYSSLIKLEKTFVANKIKKLELKEKLIEGLSRIESIINQIKNSSKILIPLRIGKHQGYLSTTIMQLVKKEREDLFNEIFKFSAPQVRSELKVRSELNKTRKITDSDSQFLGWCVLYVR